MTRDEAKQLVCDLVTEKQGCKVMDLLPQFYEAIGSLDYKLDSLVDELVKESRIIEIEYVLPGMLDYRIKSFLLPGGTDVKINDSPMKDHEA